MPKRKKIKADPEPKPKRPPLDWTKYNQAGGYRSPGNLRTMYCRECMSEGIHPDARRCPHCGVVFETAADQIGMYGLAIVGIAVIIFLLWAASL